MCMNSRSFFCQIPNAIQECREAKREKELPAAEQVSPEAEKRYN